MDIQIGLPRPSFALFSVPTMFWWAAVELSLSPAAATIPATIDAAASATPIDTTVTWQMVPGAQPITGQCIEYTYTAPSTRVTVQLDQPWAGTTIAEIPVSITLPTVATDMLAGFSTAITRDGGSNLAKLLAGISGTMAAAQDVLGDVVQSRWVMVATDQALDLLAAGQGIVRGAGETDDQLRRRILADNTSAVSGTVADIAAIVSQVTSLPSTGFAIIERYDPTISAIFTVRLLAMPSVVPDWDAVDASILAAKPAGVTYRSAGYNIQPSWIGQSSGYGFAPWGTNQH